MKNIITPFEFGAFGDGKHNDSPALQKAILEAHKKGKDLFIPAGKYYLKTSNYGNKSDGGKTAASLHIFPNMRIYGESGTVLIAAEGITHTIINDNGDNDNDNLGVTGYNGGENITLERLTFDGGKLLNNGKCTPVNISHAQNVKLRDIIVKNTGGGWHCIEINSSKNVEISGCTLGENCDCSELIQLDAATNEGNLGENDMTADKYIRIFNNYFYCNNCRAVGSHSNIKEYNGIQNWAEFIDIYNNVMEGTPCPSGKDVSVRYRPGFINFVYHTRYLNIYNNIFNRSSFSSELDEAPFFGVYVSSSCGGFEDKKSDKTIRIFNNTFINMNGACEDDSFFTVHDNN